MTRYVSRLALATLVIAGGVLVACDGNVTGGDASGDATKPLVTLINPSDTNTVADPAKGPLLVHVRASDEHSLRRVVVNVMNNKTRLGGLDTTLRLGPLAFDGETAVGISGLPFNTKLDVIAIAYDLAGNSSADTVSVWTPVAPPTGDTTVLRAGPPKVRIDNPVDTTIVWPGRTLRFRVTALDSDGIAVIYDTVRGPGFAIPGLLDKGSGPFTDSVSFETLVTIPLSVPIDSSVTFVGTARSGRGQPATSPVRRVLLVRKQPADSTPPLVYQSIQGRIEDSAALVVRAEDQNPIRRIGYRISVLTKSPTSGVDTTILLKDTAIVRTAASWRPVDTAVFYVRFPLQYRGATGSIISYADDTVLTPSATNRGWSIPDGSTSPQRTMALATVSLTSLVYGRTVALPAGSVGADIAIDTVTARRTIYVSNIKKNRLEAIDYFSLIRRTPISVGSEPWGMAIANDGNTLLVANSGGTNISQVDLNSRLENLAGRVKTPNTRAWEVTQTRDANTGAYKFTVTAYDYSDRPQYVAQSANNFVYYSTKPTATAKSGTLRRFRIGSGTDQQQVYTYGDLSPSGTFTIVNADNVSLTKVPVNTISDIIQVCDHAPGTTGFATTCVTSNDATYPEVTTVVGALGTDAVAQPTTAASLGLTDTTFVAVGGDRRWVAFGEGNTGSTPGRVMMVFDPAGADTRFQTGTPSLAVRDLNDNASDVVFGLALNKNSSTVSVQGSDAYFSDINDTDPRFQLRLQGVYATPGTGSGIAFHPDNDGTPTPADNTTRTSFLASSEASVEVVDSYQYRLRGTLPLRTVLYGALRAVTPTSAEQTAGIVVKLFGLTPEGLVVIDVRREDVDNLPPLAAARRR